MLRRLAQPATLHARLRAGPPPPLRLRPFVPALASGCRRACTTLSSAAGGSAASAASAAAATASTAAPLRRWLTSTKVPLLKLSVSDLFGHVAFALAGTAFLDPDILNLRLLSVASGGATLVFTFFHPVGRPLWLPFGWNCLFMIINSGHIYRIMGEQREASRLPPQALELWNAVFKHQGVSAVDFAKLLQAGTWTTLRKGATLQEEGQPSASVFLLVSGGADVAVGGKKVLSRKGKHQFIGDAGLSLGIAIAEPVRGIATVSTNTQSTCLVWPREQLAALLEERPQLGNAFQRAVAEDVLRKLHDEGAEEDPQQRQMHAELWHARYASVVRGRGRGKGRVNPTPKPSPCSSTPCPTPNASVVAAILQRCHHVT